MVRRASPRLASFVPLGPQAHTLQGYTCRKGTHDQRRLGKCYINDPNFTSGAAPVVLKLAITSSLDRTGRATRQVASRNYSVLVYRLLNSFNNWRIRSRFPCSVYFVENFLAVGVPDVAFWFQVMLCEVEIDGVHELGHRSEAARQDGLLA
jgi:hypothetical protein